MKFFALLKALIANKNSVVVEDKLNHASLIDAAKYAGAKLKRYRHRDIEHAPHRSCQ